MKFRNICVLAFLTITNSVIIGQINFGSVDEVSVVSFKTKPLDITNYKTEGSPYLKVDFEKGHVFTNAKEVVLEGNLRYNAYNSEIELKKNDKEFTAILKRPYISAKIGEQTYQIMPYEAANGQNRTAYFVPLNLGEVVLLYKPEVILRRGKTPNTSYDKVVPPRYIDVSSYYLQVNKSTANKIYLNKKSIFKYLNQQLAKEILKENDLKIRKKDGFLRFIELYNKSLKEKQS